MLTLERVDARYGSYRALFDVSFDVPAGQTVAVLGANGAGKSTVTRVVSGLVPATAGTVRFAGADVTRLPAHARARAGLAHVPEGRGVFSSLTVEDNLQLTYRRKLGRRGWRPAVERAYGVFPMLAHRRGQLAGTLSGGQQRMLSLAKVLAVPPKLLVVDELSLGLAPATVSAVYDALRGIRDAGSTLLVVEQHVNRAIEFADGVVLLGRGSVVWSGPAAAANLAVERLWAGGEPTAG